MLIDTTPNLSPPTTAFHFKTLNIIVKALEGGLSYV